jgi:sugar lactone lactonase YvrE
LAFLKIHCTLLMTARPFYASQCFLGEGPLWDARTQTLYWLDINAGRVYAMGWETEQVLHWDFDDAVGFAALAGKGALCLAIGTTLHRFDPDNGELHRCNDGIIDREGNLWVGTTHRDHLPDAGALYMIDKDLRVQKKLDRLTITNGMAWSPDGTCLYHIDSPTRKVECYRDDGTTGEIRWERTAVELPEGVGGPDGMTMDEKGMLWVAHWGGQGVYRWDPLTGELLSKIEVPAPQVTSCIFAGPDLDQLVITTARKEMDAVALDRFPLSGDVFIAEPGVKGTTTFRGMD